MSTSIKFRLAAYTDPAGKWNDEALKKGNEDDLFVDADLNNETQGQFVADQVETLSQAGCLMVVADGMGGMNAGEVASAIAIETVKAAFNRECLTEEVLSSPQSRAKYLEKVIVDSDAAIKKRSRVDKECEGMGSTLILAWLYDNQVTVSWCGDSRAYLYRESDGIKQISKDHSYVQSLVDEGKITIEEAFDHPYGNIVTRSLGDPEKKAEPESITVPVVKGDIILICSDGLSGVLRDKKSYDRQGNLLPGMNLEDIIRENSASMVSCREALWSAAEASDWYDNVTAILCEIVEGLDSVVSKPYDKDKTLSGSFINLRIKKKTLQSLLSVVLGLLIIAGGFVVGQKYSKSKKDSEMERFLHLRDSLATASDVLGMTVLKKTLLNMPDSVDFMRLEQIEDELTSRSVVVSECDSLKLRAIESGLNGVAASIDSFEHQLKDSLIFTMDCLGEIRTSVETGEIIVYEINAELSKYASNIFISKRNKIIAYKELVSEMTTISAKELVNWREKILPWDMASPMSKKENSQSLTEIPDKL